MKNETARREIESLDYYLQNHTDDYSEESHTAMMMAIKALEQEPKTGHWKAKSFHELFCDNCGFGFDIMRNDFIDKMNYCPNCGAKMVEPQERRGKE